MLVYDKSNKIALNIKEHALWVNGFELYTESSATLPTGFN